MGVQWGTKYSSGYNQAGVQRELSVEFVGRPGRQQLTAGVLPAGAAQGRRRNTEAMRHAPVSAPDGPYSPKPYARAIMLIAMHVMILTLTFLGMGSVAAELGFRARMGGEQPCRAGAIRRAMRGVAVAC